MECNGWKIQIFTTAVKTLNETENSTRFLVTIIILFSRISLSQKATEQVYETFPFGDYVTSATTPFLLTKR
jgi:hypothetical protein